MIGECILHEMHAIISGSPEFTEWSISARACRGLYITQKSTARVAAENRAKFATADGSTTFGKQKNHSRDVVINTVRQ